MPTSTDLKNKYGLTSLACTGSFFLLILLYLLLRPQTPLQGAAVTFELCFFFFCLAGFLTASVLAAMAGIRESPLWWLAIIIPGGCSYFLTMALILALIMGGRGWN
jgi:hypothetical protein